MQAVIGETEEATRAVSGFATEPRGLVRVTAPHDLALRQLPPLIARLSTRHPGIVVELLLTSRRVDLIEEGIDLAIRGGRLDDSSLMVRKIFSSALGIFATPAYLQRRGRPRELADLANHDCLTFGGRGGKMPWRLQGPAGEETVVVSSTVVCADMLFLREMVLLSAGLALLPAESVTAEVADGSLVRILPRYGFEGGGLFVVWPSRTLVPARVVVVREFLIEELTALQLGGPRRGRSRHSGQPPARHPGAR
jgi:DNA-binding transcriptional LysR family regulator